MVLVDPLAKPVASRIFEAEVLVLHHPTTIKMAYQAVIHCGIIRQTAAIDKISKECLRTGDKALVRFRFMMRPEFIHPGSVFIFREGNTKGIGKVTCVDVDAMVLKDTPEDLLRREEERKEAELKDHRRESGGDTKYKEDKKKDHVDPITTDSKSSNSSGGGSSGSSGSSSGGSGSVIVSDGRDDGEEIGTDKREKNRHRGGKDKAKEKEKEKEKAVKSKEKDTGGHKEHKKEKETPTTSTTAKDKSDTKDSKTRRKKE